LGHQLELMLAVANFADRGAARIFIEQGAQATQEGQIFRARLVVDMLLEIIGGNDGGSWVDEILGLGPRNVLKAELE